MARSVHPRYTAAERYERSESRRGRRYVRVTNKRALVEAGTR